MEAKGRESSIMMRESLKKILDHPKFVPGCLVMGILIRLLWIYFVNAEQVADFGVYLQRAISIASGQGYSANGIPTAYAPVGYPGFLGGLFYLFGRSVFLGKFVNVLFSGGILLLTYFVSRKIFKSERAARAALFILALHPNQIAYNGLLSAEIPFAFLILLGAAFFLSAQQRTSFLFLAGISWGLAAVTKSQAIMIPPMFIVLTYSGFRSTLKSTAIIGITGALIMAPWIFRNYVVMGVATVDTHGGIVLMQGNNPYATGRGYWDSNVKNLLGDLAADENGLFDGREVARNARA
ncbi:MAG TPA: glycosyltransferase family 39 protein, partial [Terriglobia bacterium]|nr:glycosyltransferase family 39 protein [Terriglobia bacterium]